MAVLTARLTTFNIVFLMIDCSCKIDCKMILIYIGNYTCFRSINEKITLVFGKIFIIPLVLRTVFRQKMFHTSRTV
jgi:hypothetical protein